MRTGYLFILCLILCTLVLGEKTSDMTEKSDESDKPSKTSKSDLSGESDSSNNSSSVDRKASLTDQPGITPLFAATPTRKPGSDQTKKKLLDKVWEVIEQKLGGNLGNLTEPLEEKGPNQMAPIKKAVLILRPKINERWVAREESTITWAVSNHLLSKAHKILMNCDLYMGDKMIMSVFKDVPFNIGSESWSPPVFLEPSPSYQLRLWSQPSQIGIIDEYSSQFMIVPRSDDAFMFAQDGPKATLKGFNGTAINFKGTDLSKFGDISDGPIKSSKSKHEQSKDEERDDGITRSVYTDTNVPTGIYALYPSNATSNHLFTSINFVYTLVLFTTIASIKLF